MVITFGWIRNWFVWLSSKCYAWGRFSSCYVLRIKTLQKWDLRTCLAFAFVLVCSSTHRHTHCEGKTGSEVGLHFTPALVSNLNSALPHTARFHSFVLLLTANQPSRLLLPSSFDRDLILKFISYFPTRGTGSGGLWLGPASWDRSFLTLSLSKTVHWKQRI